MIARLYRLALRAFPKRHRDRYQAEMIEVFERALEARAPSGAGPVARFVIAACLNAIGTGVAERRRWHVVRLGYAFSSLEFTMGWRMALRFPGLSVVSVFGMAVGIAVATTAFTVVGLLMDSRLPLPNGERIVSMVSVDAATSTREFRLAHDYAVWREMASMDDVGISRETVLTLIVDGRTPEPIKVAELSSSSFRIAGVGALRGRHLLPEDEAPGAGDAVVIGYDEWVERFGGDPNIIGRPVQLGATRHRIVGVMPDGFGFPINHSFWVPWRTDVTTVAPRAGPRVNVYGRLAAGVTLEAARAELTEIGRCAAADAPPTHQHLRPLVMPYVYAFTDMGAAGNLLAMRAIQLTLVLLLIVVCVNVAILVYARTASREGEIAVRTALGASRRRIVGQLFVEALTLAGAAAAIGVSLVTVALPFLEAGFLGIIDGRMPFWLDFRLSFHSVAVVVAFTLLAAGIVGILPALKVTYENVRSRLQLLAPGGGSRMQMGRLWTLLIVAQVAMTVALLPAAMFVTWDGLRLRSGSAGFASHEFVTVSLAMDGPLQAFTPASDETFRARFTLAHRQLEQRLRREPQVADVTFSLMTPGDDELPMALEAEGQAPPVTPIEYNIHEGSSTGHLVRYNRVAINFFGAFGVPMMLGRDFSPADLGTDRVIVSRTLATLAFGGMNPLGRRIKYVGRSPEAYEDDYYQHRLLSLSPSIPLERWYEVVGVVPDFPSDDLEPSRRVYHPAAFGELYPARVGVRVRADDPVGFADTLRQVGAAVSLDLQIRDVTTSEILVQREQGLFRMAGVTVGLVMLSVIALSAAGIYSLMSFTVARRRREIGIRAALGADGHQLLIGVFSRALGQLGVGALVGVLGAIGLEQVFDGEMLRGNGAVILPMVALIMSAVGALSAVGPALEGLRIQPTEALRED